MIKQLIEPPKFDKKDYGSVRFLNFSVNYYTAQEIRKANEDSQLKELLDPVFELYQNENINEAEEAVINATKEFLNNSELKDNSPQKSNIFLSYFAQEHLIRHLNPKYLLDSNFVEIHPDGMYIKSGAYILLTEDSHFLLKNFLKEERRWMFNFMDLYEEGFSEKLINKNK